MSNQGKGRTLDAESEFTLFMGAGSPAINSALDWVNVGAFDSLPKPFPPADLRGLVARAFKSAGAEDRGTGAVAGSQIPAGYYYMLGHTWLKVEENDRATVGVVPDFLKTVGIIIQLELPKGNDAT